MTTTFTEPRSLGCLPLPIRYTTLPSGTAASQSNFSYSRARSRSRSDSAA